MNWFQLPDGGQIGVQPVSLGEFAEFIRSLDYFDRRWWVAGTGPESAGGDQLLRRLGFRWTLRDQAVRGVSWFEAQAFCVSRGGRLPWLSEWESLRGRGYLAGDIPEWCREWYHPSFTGPQALQPYGRPAMRRIAGARKTRAQPNHLDGGIGFRLVRPGGRQPNSKGRAHV